MGSLFKSVGEMSGARFKDVTSIDDMLGWQSDSFAQLLQLNSKGVSAFTMEQIKAKAATLGLTDSLTAQAIALGSDANFAAKAAAGSITWGQALKDSSVGAVELGDALLKSNTVSKDAKKALEDIASSAGKTSDNFKIAVSGIIDGTAGFGDISDSFIDLGTSAEKSTGKVKNTFKGLGATLKSFATSTAGITTIILGSMLAVGALVDQFDELSYTELQDKFEQSSSSYESAKSEVESVKSELESVNSQIDAINAEPLTISSEAELANLQSQKAELEQILTLKENIAEASKNQLAYDALNASNATTSAADYLTAGMSDTTKGTVGVMDWLYGDSTLAKTLRMFMGSSTQSFADQWNAFTDENLATLDTNKIIELQKQQQEIMDWFTSTEGQEATKGNTKVFQEKQKELEQITSGLTDLQSDIAEKQSTISAQIEAMTDDTTGEALPGFEDRVASLRDTLNEISHLETIDMTDLEKSFNAIDKYFGQSSTSDLKSYFQELANEGKLTADAIEDIGISASTIGTDNLEDVVRYFNDMATAATEASTAIDGSFEGVQAAFESENAGAEWTAMADYVTQLQDLYESGKVGTDEFQSGVQYFMPETIDEDAYKYDADAYVAAWESARDKIKRYFDAENPLESMTNFTNDLIDAGKAYSDNGDITWGFKTTAEAADTLGLSVQSVEAAMHNLEDYGAEFDDVMFSGEGLERYESALDNIKSVYDSMSEGSQKDRLGELITGWDTELEKYQDDLSLLTEDQIVKIEFEYDLATIQQQIDDLDNAWAAGDRSVETGASRITNRIQYRETREEQTGYNESDDQSYAEIYDQITELQKQFNSEMDDNQRQSVQNQISALLDLQNAFQDMYSDGGVKNWDEFLGTDRFQLAVDSLINETGITKDELAGLLDMSSEDLQLKIDVELSKDELDNQLESLSEGETLTISAKVDGKDLDISALKDEDGTITYTAEIDGVEKQLSLVQNEDGTISFTADTSNVEAEVAKTDGGSRTTTLTPNSSAVDSEVAKTDGGDRTTTFNPDSSQVDAETAKTNGGNRTTTYSADTSSLPTYFSPITRTVQYVVSWIGDKLSGGSGLTGTAHVNGTAGLHPIPQLSGRALAMGTLQDESLLNPNWRTKHAEVALTGEEGPEIVVTRANRWYTVGDNGAEFAHIPQGSIIFDAKQTKELLSKGRINSRGTAMISGTSYANGWRLPSASSSSSSNSASSNKSSSSSSSKKSTSNNTSSAKKEAEEFEESVDWIVMAIDRLERAIDTLDLKASSTYRSWSSRNQNLVSEISKVSDEINLQQQGYNRYLQQANSVGLSSDLASKVRNGQIDISTITDEDTYNKVQEYQDWYEKALDCRDAIEELKETESELYGQAFDHISTMFDGIVGQLEHFRNMMEGYVDQTETAGYIVSQKYYTALIDNEEATLSRLNEERNQLIASLNDAVNSGAITKESEAWFDMQNQINEVNEAIQDSTTSIIEFKNSIRDIEWDIFDKLQDSISEITSESDFLIELMSNDKLFSDNGTITDQGKSTMGLHGVNYNVYMSQADEYRKEMEAIQADLSKDPYNQELIERRRELLELQQESILAAEDEKQAIKDLVSDGIEAELDSLSELIDQYESALSSQKDLYDYQNEIAEKQKDIATIEKQLMAYQGDDSEEGAAKRQQLQNDLEDARADLEETQWDRTIDETGKLLDQLYTDYEATLNMRLDNIDILLSDIVNNVNMEAATIRDTLISESDAVGYKMTDSMNTIWNLANQVMLDGNNKLVDGTNKVVNVITLYGDKFTSATTNVQTAINNLKTLVQQAVNDANARAQANITNTQKQQSQQTTTTKPPSSSNNSNKTNTNSKQGNGRPDVGDAVKYNSGKYYYSSDGLTPNGSQMLGQTVYITKINNADWATKPYHIARDKAGSRPLGWVALNQISGYKSGIKSATEDELAWTNEGAPETIIRKKDGAILTRVYPGDSVYDNAAHNNLWSLAHDPEKFIADNLKSDMVAPNALTQTNQTQNTINVTIPIAKVQDYNDFIKQLQSDSNAQKLIQAMALNEVAGRNKFGKYAIKFS